MKKTFLVLTLCLAAALSAHAQQDPLGIAPTPTPSPTATPAPVFTAEQKALAIQGFPNRMRVQMSGSYQTILTEYKAIYALFHAPGDGLTYDEKLGTLDATQQAYIGYIAWQLYNMLIAIDPACGIAPPSTAAPAPTPTPTPAPAQ